MFQNAGVKILQRYCTIILLVTGPLKSKESGFVSSPALPSGGLTKEYSALRWRLLQCSAASSPRGSLGELLVGSPVSWGEGRMGMDREGFVWCDWASSIIVDLGEGVHKEGVEPDGVAPGGVWSGTKSGSQILDSLTFVKFEWWHCNITCTVVLPTCGFVMLQYIKTIFALPFYRN